jgi:hypothetical protein
MSRNLIAEDNRERNYLIGKTWEDKMWEQEHNRLEKYYAEVTRIKQMLETLKIEAKIYELQS